MLIRKWHACCELPYCWNTYFMVRFCPILVNECRLNEDILVCVRGFYIIGNVVILKILSVKGMAHMTESLMRFCEKGLIVNVV